MGEKKLPIPISRFLPDRELSSNVFLRLQRNEKSLRIVNAGESIDPQLLARLTTHGHTHLEVDWDETLGQDASTYPLYQTASEEEDRSHAAAQTGVSVEGSNLTKPSLPSEGEEESVLTADAFIEEQASLKASSSTKEEAKRVAGFSDASHEEESSFAKATQEKIAQSFGADDEQEETTSIEGAKGNPEALSRLRGGPSEKEAQLRFEQDENEEEESQLVRGKAPSGAVEIYKVGGGETVEQSKLVRLEQKLEEAKEALLAGKKIDLEKEKAGIVRDAKNTILAAKIAEQIILMKEGPEAFGRINELKQQLRSAEGAEEVSNETLRQFAADKEVKKIEVLLSSDKSDSEKLISLTDKLSAFSNTKAEAEILLQEAEEKEQKNASRKAIHSDPSFPTVVGKLTSYLALSMGYSSHAYLQDLAIGAILRFDPDRLTRFPKETLPALARIALREEEPFDSASEDGLEAVNFLDVYLHDPDCDPTERDFAKKIFERSVSQVQKEKQADPWNIQCWNRFADTGPNLESNSICSKATALAIKFVRSTEA